MIIVSKITCALALINFLGPTPCFPSSPSLSIDAIMNDKEGKRSLTPIEEGEKKRRASISKSLQEELARTLDQSKLTQEKEKQTRLSIIHAQSALQHILKKSNQHSDDYPYLGKKVLGLTIDSSNIDHPFTHLLSHSFTGAKTLDEYAHSLIRLGTGAINLIPVKKGTPPSITERDEKAFLSAPKTSEEDALRHEYSLFAGDCFLFAARYLEDHLAPLFKDLKQLPQYRHHPQESGHLTTVSGQRLALDCSGSVALLYKWGLYRMEKDDKRHTILLDHIQNFSKSYAHYYTAHGSTPPSLGEILYTSPLIPLYANHLMLYGKTPVSPEVLRAELFHTAHDIHRDLSRFKTKPTPYHIKGSDEALTPKDFRVMLRGLIALHTHEFNRYTAREFHHSHGRIIGIFTELLTKK